MRRTAKIFRNGRSQAVRLPLNFALKEKRFSSGRTLKPVTWFSPAGLTHGKPFLSLPTKHLCRRISWLNAMTSRRKNGSCSDAAALSAGHEHRQLRH